MGSGKPKDNSKKNTDKAVAAMQEKSYSDPFGSFKNGVFTPNLSAIQKQTYSDIDTGIGSAINQLPTRFTVQDYYNNPYYNDTAALYQGALNQQYANNLSSLGNDLAAKGLLGGGAYGALMQNNLSQNYDVQKLQTDAAARQASVNAYQQNFQNALVKMQNLSGLKGTLQEQMYMPFDAAIGYQNAVSPLQVAQGKAWMSAINPAAAAGGGSQSGLQNMQMMAQLGQQGQSAIPAIQKNLAAFKAAHP